MRCIHVLGLRPSQEDRLVLCPKLLHDDIAFCAVFDGTVGPYASEFLMRNALDTLIQTEELQHVSRIIFGECKYSVTCLLASLVVVGGHDEEICVRFHKETFEPQ